MLTLNYDVLVIGGGASGSAAGIQSARLGARTLIVEETPWLGGMITSAGVSAFDGNKYALGGGIFGELRKKIEDYYGGPGKTFTGWISLTCFEPSAGKMILHRMAEAEKDLDIWFEAKFIEAIIKDDRVAGAVIKKKNGTLFSVNADVTVEATEFGDVLASAGIPYRLGRDSKSDTGELNAPEKSDNFIQDMTYCAILKKYKGNAPPVLPSADYDPGLFRNSTAEDSDTQDEKYLNHKLHNWESFISYAGLPNDKYLLNWPFHSNDYRYTIPEIFENQKTREYHFKKAKELTLSYVHYIQTKLGHPEWGLAEDEFPTKDKLPFIPYIRESRRMKGKYLMVESDVIPGEGSFRPPLQKSSIAVGDYFLDHHHSQFFGTPADRLVEELPANAPFQVPYESLIPANVSGFIAAEKCISVSHIVNGCTRLQPIVMLIGQAAGAAAALSSSKKTAPESINVSELQEILLDAGCQLFPYFDLWNDFPLFKKVQKLALRGIFTSNNEYQFNPFSIAEEKDIAKWIKKLRTDFDPAALSGKTCREIFERLYEFTD